MTETANPELEDLRQRVLAALELVRPALQRDGGDIEFVELDANKQVMVRLKGACQGCPHATQTIKQGVEQYIRQTAPEIAGVVQVR